MKVRLHLIYLCVALMGITTYSPNSEAARVCRQKITLPVPEVETCDIDSSNPKMGNPFAYIDPTKGCDFSFSLPGLPSFSLNGLQTMLCNQIQDIGQQAINEALAPVLEKIPSDISLDMNDMMSKMFDDQMKMQKEFCPKYNSSGKLLSYDCEDDSNNNGLPDWAVPVVDPEDNDRECYQMDGITYCKSTDNVDTQPDNNYDQDKDNELPHCSDLSDFFDANGNLIPCRNNGPRAQQSVSSRNTNSNSTSQTFTAPTWGNDGDSTTEQSNKPTWNTKKGW